MDGLSVAASGIAVVSIAVQLADSIKKLCDFWCSVKDAPEDVRAIAADLKVLSSILEEIARQTQQSTTALEAALTRCIEMTKQLSVHVEHLEKDFASTKFSIRKWSAVKSAFSSERLKKSQELLNSMKLTLCLGQQTHYGILFSRHQSDQQAVDPDKLARQMSQLAFENSAICSSPSWSSQDQLRILKGQGLPMNGAIAHPVDRPVFIRGDEQAFRHTDGRLGVRPFDEVNPTESPLAWKDPFVRQRDWKISSTIKGTKLQNLFFTVHLQSKTKILSSYHAENQRHYEQENSFTICPAQWLAKLGIPYASRVTISRSTMCGWQCKIVPFRLVPADASIFEFCATNNLSAVRSLLSRGEASVRDVDPEGWTPLHYAAGAHNVEICKLLISEGADKNVQSHYDPRRKLCEGRSRSALVVAADRTFNRGPLNKTDQINTFRLFSSQMDFSEPYSDGWMTLINLIATSLMSLPEIIDALEWVLRISAYDISESPAKYRSIYSYCIFGLVPGLEELYRLISSVSDIDIDTTSSGGYSILQIILTYAGTKRLHNMIKNVDKMLRFGANTHLVGLHKGVSPREETPTSLALYSSVAFICWRDALLRSSRDLETFVMEELKQNPLKDAGWHEDTLLSLFHGDIQPGFTPSATLHHCWSCGQEYRMIVELSWRRWLDRIKQTFDSERLGDIESRLKSQAEGNNIVRVKYSASEVKQNLSSVISDEEEEIPRLEIGGFYESDSDDEGTGLSSNGYANFICCHCYYEVEKNGSESDDTEFHC